MSKIIFIIRGYFSKKNDDFSSDDFASKVLFRYSSQKGVSDFSRQLFKSEDSESINARFAKTKLKVID